VHALAEDGEERRPVTLGGSGGGGQADWTLADRWIMTRLEQLIRDVDRLFRTFQYGEAGRQIYDFFWSEFADWYVEIAKGQLRQPETRHAAILNLVRVMDMLLRMLHPFTPFVTEEIWGHLRAAVLDSPYAPFASEWPEVLINARWPEPTQAGDEDAAALADFGMLQEMVRAIRNLRAEKNVGPAQRLPARIAAGPRFEMLRSQKATLAALAGLDGDQLELRASAVKDQQDAAVLVVGPVEIYIPFSGMVDPAADRGRLQKELAQVNGQIERLEKLLEGDFASKAPEAVVQKERDKLEAHKETAAKIRAQLG